MNAASLDPIALELADPSVAVSLVVADIGITEHGLWKLAALSVTVGWLLALSESHCIHSYWTARAAVTSLSFTNSTQVQGSAVPLTGTHRVSSPL